MNNLIVSLIIVLVVIVSISYSSQKVLNRIVVQPDFFTEELIGIEKIDLSFYGIDEENTIGVFGDRTMNGSLSLLNRKGLTKSLGESYVQQSSYRNLNDMDYFIVLDEECFDEFLAENPIAYSEINSSGKFKILKNLSR